MKNPLKTLMKRDKNVFEMLLQHLMKNWIVLAVVVMPGGYL